MTLIIEYSFFVLPLKKINLLKHKRESQKFYTSNNIKKNEVFNLSLFHPIYNIGRERMQFLIPICLEASPANEASSSFSLQKEIMVGGRL